MLLSFWITAPSFAQVEVCPGALLPDEWSEAMDAVDEALAAFDGALASRILEDLVTELPCLETPADPALLGRLARQIALVAFYAQDTEEIAVWANLARETIGDAPWPEDLELPERFLMLVRGAEPARLVTADGALKIPKGGAILLDGRLLREPAATDPVQHLLQVADKRGVVVWTDWQNGADFPEQWLAETAEPIEVPAWYVAPGDPVRRDPEPVAPEPVAAEPVAPQPVMRFGGATRCPWKAEPNIVVASRREVRVNRHTYPLRSEEDEDAFLEVLRACGELRAMRRFARWRSASEKLFGGAFAGAPRYRDAMVTALVTDEPGKKASKK